MLLRGFSGSVIAGLTRNLIYERPYDDTGQEAK